MKRRTVKQTLTAALAALMSLPAAAQDYPTFRGANRDGHSLQTGMLKTWPKEGPALAWKAAGIGGGYAGVAAFGDKLYTLGDYGDDCVLLALSAADGKILWKVKLGPEFRGKNPDWWGARATPTTDGKIVIGLCPTGDLVCVDAADGKEKWRKHLEKDFGGEVTMWKYSESPLIDGDLVVCMPGGPKGAVLALKKDTGETAWRCTELSDPAEYTSLVPVEIGGVRQYLAMFMFSINGVAAKDGKLLWRANRGIDESGKKEKMVAVIPTPIYKDGIVFTSSGYGFGHVAYKVAASGGSFKVEPLYSGKEMENHHGGVILVGNHLYALAGSHGKSDLDLVCMEMATGKVAWRQAKVGKGSLAYADGLLVCRNESKIGKRGPEAGEVVLFEISPAGAKERGRFTQPELSPLWTWAHPTIAGGKLYLRDQENLFAYTVAK
jgi:outer membrane protein assembly factor BamB